MSNSHSAEPHPLENRQRDGACIHMCRAACILTRRTAIATFPQHTLSLHPLALSKKTSPHSRRGGAQPRSQPARELRRASLRWEKVHHRAAHLHQHTCSLAQPPVPRADNDRSRSRRTSREAAAGEPDGQTLGVQPSCSRRARSSRQGTGMRWRWRRRVRTFCLAS